MKQIQYNRSERTEKIKYIVVHDTGNTSAGADAERHFSYFNGGNRSSSADFFVDDTQALQVNDYNKYYTWHCGDGKGRYGITNSNSIGIELCINSDGDYDKAFEKLIELTKSLMAKLGISADKVVRHFDASGKLCPMSMYKNNWVKWYEFKRQIVEPVEYTDANDIIWELNRRGIISNTALWLQYCENDKDAYWLCRKLCHYIRTKAHKENEKQEYTDIHNIVWDLNHRGIISNISLWNKKAAEDKNIYWLMRKGLQYIRTH